VFDGADFELIWPRQLFVDEATAVAAGRSAVDDPRVEWLLEEAFVGSAPVDGYRAAPKHRTRASDFDDPWAPADASPAPVEESPIQAEFLAALVDRAGALREASAPRPYWSARKNEGSPTPRQALRPADAKRQFVRAVSELRGNGYLDQKFPRQCVDDHDDVDVDESAVLQELLGVPDLWPLQPERWDDDTFYDLIEVFHDLVARPRERWWHGYGSCGFHYRAFAVTPGRALYRWRVNRILAASDIPLQLAGHGEDAGRLVHLVEDDRAELVDRVLLAPEAAVRDQVQHAIALFRGRNATAHDKRSAVVALAHVLERRRSLIKAELLRPDEGALFRIANEFAVRHENERQRSDYDPIFLDWVFWWYLATIELTDRMLHRNHP
jgi:hypothetical protein